VTARMGSATTRRAVALLLLPIAIAGCGASATSARPAGSPEAASGGPAGMAARWIPVSTPIATRADDVLAGGLRLEQGICHIP
jgi:hypothetical protein